jgi:hypothetical protein
VGDSEDKVTYEPNQRATPERQRRALAGVYCHVIDLTQRSEGRKPERERPARTRAGSKTP